MKRTAMNRLLFSLTCAAGFASGARAAEGPPAVSNDRLSLTANGETLTNTNGGGGAAVSWLHNFNANTIVGIGGEYQSISTANWKFATVNFAFGRGLAESRSNFYVDLHEGNGKDLGRSYDYSMETVGVYQNVTRQLVLQLEDKQIDIDATHGNLPKFGVQYLWSPRVQTGVSFAKSLNGNLGTRLYAARIDYFGKNANVLAGGAWGQASARVVNYVPGGLNIPGQTLHEGYVGVAKTFSNVDVTAVGDYQKLSFSERVTLTVSATVHLRSQGSNR